VDKLTRALIILNGCTLEEDGTIVFGVHGIAYKEGLVHILCEHLILEYIADIRRANTSFRVYNVDGDPEGRNLFRKYKITEYGYKMMRFYSL
jgi:hypothetical protein